MLNHMRPFVRGLYALAVVCSLLGWQPVSWAQSAPATKSGDTAGLPPELAPLALEAKAQFERADYARAEEIYRQILEKAPTNLYTLSSLGVVLFRAGKTELAEEPLKKAVAVAPKDEFSHCTLGIVYYTEAKYDDAISELTLALAINSRDAMAHYYLSLAASQKGWKNAAEKELETARKLNPQYNDAPP